MIKPAVKNKVKIFLGISAVFLISYILQVSFTVPLFLLVLFFYFKLSCQKGNFKNCNLLNLTLLFVIILVVSYSMIGKGLPKLYIPYLVIPMLAAILFNEMMVSLVITLASSLTIAVIAGKDLYLGLLFLTSGIVSVVLMQGIRRRASIIRVGLITGLVQALMVLFTNNFNFYNSDIYLIAVTNAIASSIIVVGVLPVFEYLFSIVTNISLLELADFNHPLQQRMIIEAPGTYHHSLVVGNLSEAACGAVGANALLARVGAYYHDIGKLQKPDYFSENQDQRSKHDALAPTMSKMVIMNHVKEGVDLANKYRLNPCLIDFILQHHGKSLVYYFYRRALESLEDDHEVKEEGFRYPGPKPDTKETAIVLLADSTEAATRALRNPHPAQIEELVHKVINNKFIDGQLDECDLTLKDIEKISAVFIRILNAIYRNRITYPEETKS